jgi:hypothetical protein
VRERLAERELGFEAGVFARRPALVVRVEELAEPRGVGAAALGEGSEAGAAVGPEQQLGDSDLERAGDRVGARGGSARNGRK